MNKPKHYISEGAAVELLKRIWGASEADSLTLNEIYNNAGRGELDDATNRNWLNTVMTKLRYHNLITPVYKYDGRKKVDRIKLTLTGKTFLGKAGQVTGEEYRNNDAQIRVITPQTVHDDIEVLKKQYPSFTVGLIFEPKDKPMHKA